MLHNRFWLNLVGLCTIIACIFALALAVISASAAIAFPSHQDPEAQPQAKQDAVPQQRAFNGVVTDSSCHARHTVAGKGAAECARECVGRGSSYVLVGGEGVYRLDGNTTELDKVAGERVQVIGMLDGHVLTVSSISAAQ